MIWSYRSNKTCAQFGANTLVVWLHTKSSSKVEFLHAQSNACTERNACKKIRTNPFLAVRVFDIVVRPVIPRHTETQQLGGVEAVHHQDHEVVDETGQSLDHTCEVTISNSPGQKRKTRQQMSTALQKHSPVRCLTKTIYVTLTLLNDAKPIATLAFCTVAIRWSNKKIWSVLKAQIARTELCISW